MRSSSEWNDTATRRPPRLEDALGGVQRGDQFAQLVIDENAQRLERARRRMNIARARAHHRGDDVGQRRGGADRRLRARLDDGAGDGARMTLLAEQENDIGEIALARAGDDIGRARALAAHAHVERPVEAEGKSALRRYRAAWRRRRDRAPRRRRHRCRRRAPRRRDCEKRSSTSVSRPLAACTRGCPSAIAFGSRSMPMTLQLAAAKDGARYSRRRRRWRRYRCRRHAR